MEGVEARRKILRGRKTITRRYYCKSEVFYKSGKMGRKLILCVITKCIRNSLGGTAIPAWSIVLLIGISMLFAGAGLYVLLQKFVVDNADTGERHSTYQPALQNEA